MVLTDKFLHGIPPKRIRTFYFFWWSATVPILSWKLTQAPSLIDYLAQIPPMATQQDIYVHDGPASDRYLPYKFLLQKYKMQHKEFYQWFGRGTVAKYLEKHNLMDECISWLNREHPGGKLSRGNKGKTHVEVLEGFKNKLKLGLGYWDESVKFMGTSFSAVISKNITSAVHPTEDRYFNVRELLHLMGMPHDFELVNPQQNINHLCQNVPVNTSKDWADEVVKFCKGEAKMSKYSYIKQDNIKCSISVN